MNFKILIFCIFFCYIFFETPAFIEYFTLFKLKFTKYKEYNDIKSRLDTLSYNNFLLMNYDSFFIRLITCPICLSVWLNLLMFLMTKNDFSEVFFNIILTWIGYFSLVKLLKLLYE